MARCCLLSLSCPLRESQWVAVSESPIYSTVPAVDCPKICFVSVFIFFKIFWWNFKQIQRNKNKINLWLKKLQVSCSVSVMEVMAWLHTWWCSWQILRPLRSKPNYFPHSLAAHRAQHRCAAERLLDVLSNSWNSFSEIQIFRVFMDTLVYCQFFLISKKIK